MITLRARTLRARRAHRATFVRCRVRIIVLIVGYVAIAALVIASAYRGIP